MYGAEISRLVRHSTYWLLQQRRGDLAVDRAVRAFGPGVQQLLATMGGLLTGDYLAAFEKARDAYLKVGAPAPLVRTITNQPAVPCDPSRPAARLGGKEFSL